MKQKTPNQNRKRTHRTRRPESKRQAQRGVNQEQSQQEQRAKAPHPTPKETTPPNTDPQRDAQPTTKPIHVNTTTTHQGFAWRRDDTPGVETHRKQTKNQNERGQQTAKHSSAPPSSLPIEIGKSRRTTQRKATLQQMAPAAEQVQTQVRWASRLHQTFSEVHLVSRPTQRT